MYSKLSYLAVKVEATENTAVKPDTFIPFLNEGIVTEYQPNPAMPISTSRTVNRRPIPKAIPAPTADIAVHVEPKTFGHFLKGIFGAVTTGRYVGISGGTGTLEVGETITGGTSSSTGTVLAVSEEGDYILIGSPSAPFTDGETITGGTSSATRTLGNYEASVYGHEFKAPQNALATYSVEFGYENEAHRFIGVKFSALGSLAQSDDIINANITIFARAHFRAAKITAITTSGSGSKVISVDQTQGLVVGDSVKIYRPGTGFLDFSATNIKTHTIGSISAEASITVTNLETATAVGDLLVLAPQTTSYVVDREFSWIGGTKAKVGSTMTGALTASDADVEDFEMVLINEIEPRHAANNTNFANRFPVKNHLKGLTGSGKITRSYSDVTNWAKLRNIEAASVQIKHEGNVIGSTTVRYTMDLRYPTVYFDNFANNINENEVVPEEIPFTMYNSGSGYAAKCILVNDITSY